MECVILSIRNFTVMKENGSICEWSCLNWSKPITSAKQQPPPKKHEEGKLQTYISEQINLAVRAIINTTWMNFQTELEKLKNENKNLQQAIRELKEMIKMHNSSSNLVHQQEI